MRLSRLLISSGLVISAIVSLLLITAAEQRQSRVNAERALAEAISRDLHGWVEQRARVIAELAQRFGSWESLPPLALERSIGATARRHLSLRQILVADPAGRLLAGYDSNRRLGAERLSAGRLDPVLARRDALRGTARIRVLSRSQGGRLQQLDLAAPLRGHGGHLRGYVGASLDLQALRRNIAEQAWAGLCIDVEDLERNRILSCGSKAPSGSLVVGRRLRVRVAITAAPPHWPVLLASGLSLGVLLVLIGLWWILDSRRKMLD